LLGPFERLVPDLPPLIPVEKMPGLLLWGGERSPDRWPQEGLAVPPGGERWRRSTFEEPVCRLPVDGAGRWPRWFYAAAYLRCHERFRGSLAMHCEGCFLLRVASRPVLWHLGWPRPRNMPPAHAPLDLPEGCHLLLLKLISYGRPLRFGTRLTDLDGRPVHGRRPIAVRTSPLQGMRLNVPSRGKRLPARADVPTLCAAGRAEEGQIAADPRSAAWSKGNTAASFRCLDGKRARWQTAVSFAYTETALHALFECENHRPCTEGEPLPWLSDHVVLLLDPGHSHERSVAILLNLNGELWARGIDLAAIESDVQRTGDGWVGMLKIPFDSLPGTQPPREGERWGVNLLRICPDSSDGITYWSDALLHWDTEELVPGSAGPGAAAGRFDWPLSLTLPGRFGHLEFGQNQIRIEKAALGQESPGRLQVRLSVGNRGGKARAFLRYEVEGCADVWPSTVGRMQRLQSGRKAWLLPARSRTSGSVTLEPVPPGCYAIRMRIEVPGRNFVQSLAIPFLARRELCSGEGQVFDGGAPAGARARSETVERRWNFYLAEKPPHELLLTLRGSGPRGRMRAAWNGNALGLSDPPDETQPWQSEAHLPPAFINEGANRLEIVASAPGGEEVPKIEQVRLRLCEKGLRDIEAGRYVYECSFDAAGPPCAEWALLSREGGGVPHRAAQLVPMQEGRPLRFPLLLDRPGGTLELTHAEFRLEIGVLLAESADRTEPLPLQVELNGEELQIESFRSQPCFLERRRAVLWHYVAPVPERLPRNGVNYVALSAASLGDGPAFLEGIRLTEGRWDDPEVVGVPRVIRVGDRFNVKLRTDRPHALTCCELPPYLGARFECPLAIGAGETELEFEARAPGVPTRAVIRLDEGLACFTSPAILPGRRAPWAARASRSPVFHLADGPQELYLSAIRGRLRQEGRDEFAVAFDGVTIPYGSERQMRAFRSLLHRTAFLSGADVSEEVADALPALHRRDGLPAVEVAVLTGQAEVDLDRLACDPQGAVKGLRASLLAGAAFPGPGGPLFPDGPTGHFSGTPRGKFDVIGPPSAAEALRGYRVLLVEEGAASGALASELLGRLVEEGAAVLLSAADGEALARFGISQGRPVRAKRVRFASGDKDRDGLEVAAGGKYLTPGSEPDVAHAALEPSGSVALGEWRRGRGSVFVAAAPLCGGCGELQFRSCCFDHIVRKRAPFLWCDNELVSFGVFPQQGAAAVLPAGAGGGSGLSFPSSRIYLTDVNWWFEDGQPVACTLFIGGLPLPLQWPAGRVKAVFLSGELVLTDAQDALYFETASRRERGYEVQVRGSGRGDIMALPTVGQVCSVTSMGQDIPFRPVDAQTSAVRFDLEVAGMRRFELEIGRGDQTARGVTPWQSSA